MKFGVNKCASLVVQGEASKFLNNNDPTFYLSRQELSKTNCIVSIWFSTETYQIYNIKSKLKLNKQIPDMGGCGRSYSTNHESCCPKIIKYVKLVIILIYYQFYEYG